MDQICCVLAGRDSVGRDGPGRESVVTVNVCVEGMRSRLEGEGMP